MGRPRASGSEKSAGLQGKKTPEQMLDELLPLAVPSRNEIHEQSAVLEVDDPSQLLELATETTLRPFLLCRLAAKVVLVDPGRAEELAEALRRRGHTPKIMKS